MPGVLFALGLWATGAISVGGAPVRSDGGGAAGRPVEEARAETEASAPKREAVSAVETGPRPGRPAAGGDGTARRRGAVPGEEDTLRAFEVRPGYIVIVSPKPSWYGGAIRSRRPPGERTEGGAWVPRSRPADGKGPDDALAYLNAADEAALVRLSGVGPVRAKEILRLRAAKGGFRSWDDLLEVRGIGEKTLARIRLSARSLIRSSEAPPRGR